MVQNAVEGMEDVKNVNAEQGCSHAELLIVGNSNKLVYLTSRFTALSGTKLHYIFHCSLTDKAHAFIQEGVKGWVGRGLGYQLRITLNISIKSRITNNFFHQSWVT